MTIVCISTFSNPELSRVCSLKLVSRGTSDKGTVDCFEPLRPPRMFSRDRIRTCEYPRFKRSNLHLHHRQEIGRGTCGHGNAAGRGGVEPRRPKGHLLPKYLWPAPPSKFMVESA